MVARSPVTKAQFEALAAFRYALRRFLRFSEEEAERAGLTPHQHQALLAIEGYPGRDCVTIGELAERLQIRHHSTVGLVDRLVEHGLAERAPGKEDRRTVFVRVTDRGREKLAALAEAHWRELQRIGPEVRAIAELLGQPAEDAKRHDS